MSPKIIFFLILSFMKSGFGEECDSSLKKNCREVLNKEINQVDSCIKKVYDRDQKKKFFNKNDRKSKYQNCIFPALSDLQAQCKKLNFEKCFPGNERFFLWSAGMQSGSSEINSEYINSVIGFMKFQENEKNLNSRQCSTEEKNLCEKSLSKMMTRIDSCIENTYQRTQKDLSHKNVFKTVYRPCIAREKELEEIAENCIEKLRGLKCETNVSAYKTWYENLKVKNHLNRANPDYVEKVIEKIKTENRLKNCSIHNQIKCNDFSEKKINEVHACIQKNYKKDSRPEESVYQKIPDDVCGISYAEFYDYFSAGPCRLELKEGCVVENKKFKSFISNAKFGALIRNPQYTKSFIENHLNSDQENCEFNRVFPSSERSSLNFFERCYSSCRILGVSYSKKEEIDLFYLLQNKIRSLNSNYKLHQGEWPSQKIVLNYDDFEKCSETKSKRRKTSQKSCDSEDYSSIETIYQFFGIDSPESQREYLSKLADLNLDRKNPLEKIIFEKKRISLFFKNQKYVFPFEATQGEESYFHCTLKNNSSGESATNFQPR